MKQGEGGKPQRDVKKMAFSYLKNGKNSIIFSLNQIILSIFLMLFNLKQAQ